MPVNYNDIRTDRQWRAATGLNQEQFFKLVPLFKSSYEKLFDESVEDSQKLGLGIVNFRLSHHQEE
ncbi:MAG: hypothetical protein ACI8YQ_003521 [Polaribacter sp.]|jgi:hypothetical protein